VLLLGLGELVAWFRLGTVAPVLADALPAPALQSSLVDAEDLASSALRGASRNGFVD